jgi:hypothetical protein
MRRFFAIPAILLLSGCAANGAQERIECMVTNPLDTARENEPVVIRSADILEKLPGYAGEGYVHVYEGDTEVCAQQDDLDGDGRWDELVFMTDFKPEETKTFVLSLDPAGKNKPLECPGEMNAQMFFNNPDKSITPTLEASSTADDMYDKMYHHGPAWESDKIGYRLYFDKKTTVDVYGKKVYRMELADTKWYPSEQQLADKYGDDILWVGNSVGVGTLKGWDGQSATHIDTMSKRTARIVINGNLRTVVDMKVEGWRYQGRSLDVTARYIQYARHRDMIAQVIVDGPAGNEDLVFSTGVQKVRRSETYSEEDGLIALWGTEYPQPDSVKYERETFGLGVIVPTANIEKFATDPLNHLIVLQNNRQPVIEYYVTAASLKEEAGYKTAAGFFDYMRGLKQLVHHPVEVKLKNM